MTESNDQPGTDTHGSAGGAARTAVRGVLGLIGSIVRFVTGLFAAILVVAILLVVLGANPANGVARFIIAVANILTIGLGNLFLVAGPVLQAVLSYGIPAIVWLIVGAVIVAVLRALARPTSGLR